MKMNLNRRGFFAAAAASPFAAKEAAKTVVEEAAKIQAAAMQASGMSTYSDTIYTGISTSYVAAPQKSLWDAIMEMGVPDWKEQDLRIDAKRSRTLDPDIASMKSFSLQAKLNLQWERNYKLLVERALQQKRMEKMKKTFFETNPDVSEY